MPKDIMFKGGYIEVRLKEKSLKMNCLHYEGSVMDKKVIIDGRIIYADQDTIDHIEKTREDTPTASSEENHVSVRISIMMEAALLKDLKSLAEEKKLPYQTMIKTLLREKIIESRERYFTAEKSEFTLIYEGMKPCLISTNLMKSLSK